MKRIAFRVSAIYLVVACCWIFFSDKILAMLVTDTETITRISIVKGWLFVVVTALLLFWLVLRDVRALSASRDYYLKVLDDFPALIWRSGPNGACDYFNSTWLSFTGRTLDQEMGDGWAAGVHPEDADSSLTAYRNAFGSRRPFSIEYRLQRHDGEYRWLSDYGRPFYGLDGKFAGYIGACFDITERKRTEHEIAQLYASLEMHAAEVETANAKLVEANEELETFSFTVSHDLRSPLTNISTIAQLVIDLHESEVSPRVKEYLLSIVGETDRMSSLISALLNLSHLSRKELELQSVDLSSLAAVVAGSLRKREPERQATIAIGKDLLVEGDPYLLQVVLENLLGNAWKYSRTKEAVSIEFDATGDGGERIFFVRDRGVGFNMGEAHRLFGTFQRLHSGDFEGFGIGLATVRRIVQRHGGAIWAEGQPGEGATFYFTLPGLPS